MYKRVTESEEMCIMMVSWKDKTVLGGQNLMKKLTAMLLALVMLALPVLGLAESPAEMLDAAVEAGRPLKTNIQFNWGSFPGMDEETATIINDLVDAIGIVCAEQEGQVDFALQLTGTDVLTFAAAGKDEDTYISSNLLGGTIAFNDAEGQVLLDYLMNLAVASGMMTESDLAEVKTAIEQAAGQVTAQAAEVNLEDLDLTGLMTIVTELAAKVQAAEVTQQPKNCDAAATVITMTLTGEDVTKLYNAIFDVAKNVPQFMDALATLELNMNGEAMTTEEFVAKMPELAEQIGGMIQGEIPVAIYLDSEGNPVYGTLSMTMKNEDDAITMEVSYARLTVNEAVTHAVNVIAKDTADEGIAVSVNVQNSDKLDTVNVGIASIAAGVAEPVITVDVKVEKEYGETESEEDTEFSVVIVDSDSKQEISFLVDVESEAKKVGEDVTCESDIDLHILGLEEELLCIKVTQTTGEAAASIVTADAVRPGQMTEEEFNTYVSEDVMNAAMTALMGLIQNLPASVLELMMQ